MAISFSHKKYTYQNNMTVCNQFDAHQNSDIAVLSKWTAAIINSEPVWINGDDRVIHDFCCTTNILPPKLLKVTAIHLDAADQAHKIAQDGCIVLIDLFKTICATLEVYFLRLKNFKSSYGNFYLSNVRCYSFTNIFKNSAVRLRTSHRINKSFAGNEIYVYSLV